ncbi:MAG: hypothetical protein HY923_02310 [Elusimicrobia bacterium]|nr:hypothetical protein [Elusimicrobiota bacterium]
MLPSVETWLSESWSDYRRRFWPLMSVLAIGGLVTAFFVLLPLAPAGLAAYLGLGSPWLIWGAASAFALLAGLWFSTWAQAAAMLAASTDGGADRALREGWRLTPAFAWVLSLVLLAVCGGFAVVVLPGMILTVLLFFAPFYQLHGEASGLAAVELSFARARPYFGAVAGRLALIALLVWVPSFIPYVGWLLSPLWAPFGLVAGARLAGDLRALAPDPVRTSLGPAIAALSLVFVVTSFSISYFAARGAAAMYASYASGEMRLPAPDGTTSQSLIALLQGHGTDEDVQRSLTYVIALSSAAGKSP